MNKQIEDMAKIALKNTMSYTCAKQIAMNIYNAGYSRREDVAREIFEELSATIMPLVESHNRIAEKTGDIEWGYKADGMEIALLTLKGILKKYGVSEE